LEELKGKTLEVYKCFLRAKEPLGVSDIQRILKLSSPSLAYYHIQKLLDMGLIKNEGKGYTVDKVIEYNIVRMRGIIIPKYFFFFIFFLVAFILELTYFKPNTISSQYLFSLMVTLLALILFSYETLKLLKRFY